MNVYIWENVEKVSDNYHEGGGVVVFADSEEEARSFANSSPGCSIKPEELPQEVRACADGPRMVYIMPDAGCC